MFSDGDAVGISDIRATEISSRVTNNLNIHMPADVIRRDNNLARVGEGI